MVMIGGTAGETGPRNTVEDRRGNKLKMEFKYISPEDFREIGTPGLSPVISLVFACALILVFGFISRGMISPVVATVLFSAAVVLSLIALIWKSEVTRRKRSSEIARLMYTVVVDEVGITMRRTAEPASHRSMPWDSIEAIVATKKSEVITSYLGGKGQNRYYGCRIKLRDESDQTFFEIPRETLKLLYDECVRRKIAFENANVVMDGT